MIQTRLQIVFIIGMGVIGLIFVRLIHLQIFKGNEFARKAFHSHYRRVNIDPARGSISDRHDRLLAATVVNDSVYADPVQVANLDDTVKHLGSILSTSENKLRQKLSQKNRRFVWLKRGVTPDQADCIAKTDIPGVFFRRESRRVYPTGDLFAPLLGFTGVDGHGLAGIEAACDQALAGITGQDLQAFDALARPYSPDKITLKEPRQGQNVKLTIDKTIQYFASREIKQMLEKENASWGAAVVMDVHSGDLLAAVSLPSFNPHRFTNFTADNRRNRCFSQVIEPGSTFKAFTLASSLETQAFTLDTSIDCQQGKITVGNSNYSDWKAFDSLSVRDVLVFSSNVGTIKMAQKSGGQALMDLIKRFGFGSAGLKNVPGVENGFLRESNKHSPTGLASLSIGYGVAVTPLQLAAAYAVFANGGYKVTPKLYFDDPRITPEQVLEKNIANQVKTVLAETISRGTGKKAAPHGYTAGGKTGTARRYNTAQGRYESNRVTCVFAGFAPVENPRISVCIVIDDPKHNKWASTVSAKVFANVVSRTLLYLGESPERKIAA